MAPDGSVEQGQAALAVCDWATARSCFEAAIEIHPAPAAVAGLGLARYWQGDYAPALTLLERAYGLHRDAADRRAAARLAIQLAMLHGLINGDGAAVGGWLAHAQRMLDDEGDCREAGWMELFLACIASDPAERRQRATDAAAVGRRFADPDLEFDALAYLGKADVEDGRVVDGMRRIDEAVAAVTSGVVADPWATAEILCTLFHACELAVDVARAEEWLAAVDRHVDRTGELPVFGICRMHYGGLLTAVGRWADAERELLTAIAVYDVGYHGTRFEAVLRLADLRARQGGLEEAQRLLTGYEELAGAALPRARLHLARREPDLAATVLERFLARRGRGVGSASALALLVRAELDRDRAAAADALAQELDVLGRACGQAAVAGLAALSRARVMAATGADAAPSFEAALAAFSHAGLTYDLAATRLELATVLATEQPEVARAEARAALAGFQQLEAGTDADAAAGLLRRLGDRRRTWAATSGRLTRREAEVLELLGEGLTNSRIAERLFISPRTAEHHVGNILSKLGLANRTEAAAYCLRQSSAAGGPATPAVSDRSRDRSTSTRSAVGSSSAPPATPPTPA